VSLEKSQGHGAGHGESNMNSHGRKQIERMELEVLKTTNYLHDKDILKAVKRVLKDNAIREEKRLNREADEQFAAAVAL
jgi:hypothetical protein